mgnify:CR=1 FL=1
MYSWLNSSHYDFKYTSLEFFENLSLICNINEIDIQSEIKEYTELLKELARFKNNSIFINTAFKRKGEPIFALGFSEYQRRIKLDPEEFIYKTDDEILHLISTIVKQHYLQSKGDIGIWGKVKNYLFEYNGKKYVFDINGMVTEDEVFENRAILRVDGKDLISAIEPTNKRIKKC